MWYRDWDFQPFEDETSAREAALEKMTVEDYGEFFDFIEVLSWCLQQEKFLNDFAEEIQNCQNEYFQEHFTEDEEDEETDL